MKLDDVEARAQGCVAVRLYPEGPEDERDLRALTMVIRGLPVKLQFDALLNEVRIVIKPEA